VPIEPRSVSRRSLLVSAALVPGAVTLAGCKDDPAGSTPGAVNPSSSDRRAQETPTADPAVVAALSAAATQVTQLSLAFAGTSRKFPALRTQLAAGAKYHASHLAKLKETAGVTATAGKPAVAGTSAAALTALARQEKAAAIAHAAAAAKVSGAPARLLAMIAAAETQLATTLTPKKKANAS
jgi:hypothetical protein